MTVLVTGGAGYIGSHMVLALCDRGEDVVVLDNLATGMAFLVSPKAHLVEGDIGDLSLVTKLISTHRIDAIIHFAGSVVVPESVAHPLKYYENNTAKSRTLIEASVLGKVPHFIFSSTAAVYGSPSTHTASLNEESPLQPLSPYGFSKWMTEQMLQDCSKAYGLKTTILRYFNVAGADPQGRSGQATVGATHLLKVACEVALKKRAHLEIFGTDYPTPDGTGIRDYIHVSDLISAHIDALDALRQGKSGDLFNCGYGLGTSVLEVIAAVEKISGVRLPVKKAERRPGDAAKVVANSDKIQKDLLWRPRYASLDTIVETALAWEKHLSQRNT